MNQIRTILVSGSVPTVNQLALGDIAINTVDGKAYLKKYSGSIQTVIEIGSGITPISASYALTASYVNPLRQAVYISGSLNVTGSTIQIGNNTLLGNTTLSGSIIISGSTTTPATPTIKIYGDMETNGVIKFDPVVKNIDTSISASYIYVSGSTNDLYFSQNGDGYNNVTRLRWLEGNLYTGLLNGGLITTASSTTFNISSGSGIIVNLNASINANPYPTIQYINWGNLNNQTLTYLTSSIQTFVGIDSSGSIIQQTTPWTDGQYNTSIQIGTVLHQNKSTINSRIAYPNVAYGYKQRTYDFIKAFGPLKLSGYTIFTSSSLGLEVGSGTAFADGRNYQVDPNNPSYITDVGTSVSKIFRYYQSGSEFVQDTNGGLGYTVIDPANYNPGASGSLTAVSPSKFTIQRVFWYPNSATKGIVVYYGNTEYGTLAEGVAGIPNETFSEVENTKQNAVYLGAIVIKGNATFLSTPNVDYQIVAGGLFRATIGGGGGGGGGGSTVSPFPYTGSAEITGSLRVIGPVTASSFTGSFTGSLFGTASNALTASYLNPLAQTVRLTGSLVITGSVLISSSATFINVGPAVFTGSAGTGSAVSIYKSGSTAFDIQGSSGQLFAVTDSLTGSLFSVNTAAGLPVIEAFSDNTVNIGKFGTYPIKVAATGTLAVITGSFTGSFTGSATTAVTASYALTSSFPWFQTGSNVAYVGGNTGIGVTAPVGKLGIFVSPSTGVTSTPISFDYNGNALTTIQSYNVSGYYQDVIINTSNGAGAPSLAEVLRIKGQTGYIGIGTSAPQRRLHVDSSGSANTDLPLILTSVDTNNRVGILFASSSLSSGRQHRLFHRTTTSMVEWLLGTNAGDNAVWYLMPRDDTSYSFSVSTPYNGGTVYASTGINQPMLSLGAGGLANQYINISASGNVGINTTTPTARFQIKGSGTTSATTVFRVENSSTIARLTILDDGTFAVNTNNLYVSSSGQVGIGTTTPSYALQINGTGLYYDGGSGQAQLLITTSGSVNKEGSFIASSTGRTLQMGISDNSTVPVGIDMFATNNSFPSAYLNFRVNNADLVRMTGSFVGIGTTSPTTTLDVSGSGRFTNGLTVTGSTIAKGDFTVTGATTTDINTSTLNINAPLFTVPSFATPYSPSATVRVVMYDAVSNALFVTASAPASPVIVNTIATGSITASVEIGPAATVPYFFLIQSGSVEMLKINAERVMVLEARTTTPTAVTGGIYYSASGDFYFGM